MDKPGGEGAIKQQMIDCYVQTLAKVLEWVDGLPGVLFVLLDSYMDPEYKDYGAQFFCEWRNRLKIPRKAEKGGSCSSENKGQAEVQ